MLLDDQPGNELKVTRGFHLFARIGELAATPGKKIARILAFELRGNGGNEFYPLFAR